MPVTNLASAGYALWNYLEKNGYDAASIYKGAKLNCELMTKPGCRFPNKNLNQLWRDVSGIVNDPCFGIELPKFWHPSNLGFLGYAMLASHSLRTSLERFVRYHRVVSNFDFIRMDETNESLNIILLRRKEFGRTPAQVDALFALIMEVCRRNYIGDLAPVSVAFTHSKPDCAKSYFSFFQSPVIFNAKSDRLALPLDAIDKNLPGGHPQLAEFHDQLIIEYLHQMDEEDIVQKIKAEIIRQLPSGNVTRKTVAREIAMSTRSMQRSLQEEGTTFSTIQNETRLDLAKQYLTGGNVDMTELAFILGFSEVSAFSRAFRRWTGMSPSQFQKAA